MSLCMRTTVRLNDDLLRRAKKAAAESDRTLTAVIEDALRLALVNRPTAARAPFRMKTFRGSGLQPGVDINSWSSLLDAMETKHATR